MVPVTGSPVVVLVLQLYPADTVDLRIDELLVARRAVFRRLIHALVSRLCWAGHVRIRKLRATAPAV